MPIDQSAQEASDAAVRLINHLEITLSKDGDTDGLLKLLSSTVRYVDTLIPSRTLITHVRHDRPDSGGDTHD